MSYLKPGRLYRVLGKAIRSRSIFALYSEPLGTLYDSAIHSVIIRRGKSGRGGGSFPSTLEASVKGLYAQAIAGNNVRFVIRDSAAAELAAFLAVPTSTIERRFTGRLGQTGVEDTGKKFTTTFSAASWIAQMNYSPAHFAPPAGMSVLSALFYLAHADEPNRGISVNFHGAAGTIAKLQERALFKEGVTRYAADIGILLQERRNGETHILPHLYRKGEVASALATRLPLTRSQAISPARWEQRNDRPPIRIEYKITNAQGEIATRVAEIASTTGETRETVEVDWSYVKSDDVDNQLYREAYGRVLESSVRQYTVPSVTVDLLSLIGSDKQYHRDQAGQLLALEAGDPIYFSGDWPAQLQGVHFAEGITETIDADNWKLELSLVPYAQVIGDAPSPIVPAQVWDSAFNRWDEETKKWNEA